MTKITPIAEMSTDRTFFAHVGPTRVRVRTVGDGPALLLLMGIGGNLDMWDPLAQRLPGRRLIMFDFPGAGASSSSFLPPTMMHNALFTRLLMLRLGYGRADVLGYSWGGLRAQELAFQHPWAVRRLVLAATSLGLSGIPPAPQVIWRMLTTRRFYSPEYLAEIAASTYGGRFRREPGLSQARLPAGSGIRPAELDTPSSSPRCFPTADFRSSHGSPHAPSCWPATTTPSSPPSTNGSCRSCCGVRNFSSSPGLGTCS
jgi:pimeloyl-ACP methyl ester carboxylesterase